MSNFQKALNDMTEVAEHINEMKKKYDAAVHIQEIQSLIRGWEVQAWIWSMILCGDELTLYIEVLIRKITIEAY